MKKVEAHRKKQQDEAVRACCTVCAKGREEAGWRLAWIRAFSPSSSEMLSIDWVE